MVSFHKPLSPTRRKIFPELIENLPKKRRLNEAEDSEVPEKSLIKAQTMKSMPDTNLHLETPLPLEWQRCLDIKSGQIYFYNSRTRKRQSNDPRSNPEPSSPAHMSLDLELNLPCGSAVKNQVDDQITMHNPGSTSSSSSDHHQLMNSSSKKNTGGLTRSPSWLTFEGEQQEMVTAVCKKCHMLVMMCKSSPSCPNCKFMHPPEQSTPNLFKRKLSLLC